ncbi:MAG: glucose-6-phosphate isomerase, partial [Actinobacteria bacterium]|nr:glucose-6-phosphate isomerase [Actinomycetota bacterium]
MSRTRCDRTPAWGDLQAAFAATGRAFDLRSAFACDAGRFERFSLSAPHVFADLSKNLIDATTLGLLLALARQCGVAEHRDAMFAGAVINNSEQRQVLHTLLRHPAQGLETPRGSAPQNLAAELAQVHATLDAMLVYAEAVRQDSAIT